jgi:imidazolonepropionase-like amidohydrolase
MSVSDPGGSFVSKASQAVLSAILALLIVTGLAAQQPATFGKFTLHKFAKAIGQETYSIQSTGDIATLTSRFLFVDRGSPVPLQTTFVLHTPDGSPVSYAAKGRASRLAAMDDALTLTGASLSITRSGKTQTVAPTGPWFITDGYSPVAMQEQMMRWWLGHSRPAQFTVYPSGATVHIEPSGTLSVHSDSATFSAHGYAVAGLIWGQESLWLDDDQNLVALVSTDAEFDHFEAVRTPYESSLGAFIAAGVNSNLAALAQLSAASRMPTAKRLAIVGVTLEDSTGAPPIPDSVILIQDGVIKAVGTRPQVHIPHGTQILNAAGKFAIPGLWDMHAHYEQVEWGPIYLAAGVTSVRDVGNEFDFITALHEQLDRRRNPAIGPHLEFAGIVDGLGPISLGAITAGTPEQAVDVVQRYKAAGARQIKIYSSVKPEIVKAICAAAHQRGLTVTGHIPQGMTAIEGINDGMDQINHIQYDVPYFAHPALNAEGKPDRTKPPVLELDSPKAKEFIQVLKDHHTVLDPTMVVFESFMHTAPFIDLEPGIAHLPPQLREALDSPVPPPNQKPILDGQWNAFMATLRTLHAAGIPMVAGTDQTIPGYSLHRELEIYVEAGFTPLEALQSATIVAARALGVESESGSLAKGKRGDVLLLDADPLADIHNTRKVFRTIAAGTVYTPAPLWQSVGFQP